MIKQIEVKTIEHKNIKVTVGINYFKGEIALLEYDTERKDFAVKKWTFENRGLEFMQGWQNILDAMKYAIKIATDDLAAFQKEKQNEAKKIVNEAGNFMLEVFGKESGLKKNAKKRS